MICIAVPDTEKKKKLLAASRNPSFWSSSPNPKHLDLKHSNTNRYCYCAIREKNKKTLAPSSALEASFFMIILDHVYLSNNQSLRMLHNSWGIRIDDSIFHGPLDRQTRRNPSCLAEQLSRTEVAVWG